MADNRAVRARPSLANIHLAIEEDNSPATTTAKKRVLENLLVVSLTFLLLFTAYQSLQNLQSSINAVEGLGTASLATIYAALVTSCMFVPSYMIHRLGLKYTMVVSMSMYLVYFAANMEPVWITLLPASLILGLGGAPLWTANCCYLTTMAKEYADLAGALDPAPFVAGFFGVFFMMFQTTQIWGNIIAYVILRPPHNIAVTAPSFIEHCGSSFHPTEDLPVVNKTNLFYVSAHQVATLSTLYTVCVLAAIVMMVLFLDPVPKEVLETSPPMQLLGETINQMRKGYQQLIIPLTVYSGLQQAFFWGDYTQAYISCSWGVQYVGYVMIAYGVTDAICSLTFGFLVKEVGRIPIVLAAAILDMATMYKMLTWQPTPEQRHNYFIIATLWAIADASWQTQINAFYGIIFAGNQDAAFANYRLWESMGLIMMFAVQSQLRLYVKAVGLLFALMIGVAGYLAIEFHRSSTERSPF